MIAQNFCTMCKIPPFPTLVLFVRINYIVTLATYTALWVIFMGCNFNGSFFKNIKICKVRLFFLSLPKSPNFFSDNQRLCPVGPYTSLISIYKCRY